MKSQDLLFFITITLLLIKKGKYLWMAGMLSLIGSAFLFLIGNLYTSQRLSWYAMGFLFCATIKEIADLLTKPKTD